MRTILLFILISLTIGFYGCNLDSETKGHPKNNENGVCEPYFNFDSVEYYFIERDNKFLTDLSAKPNKSENENGLLKMIFEDESTGISDTINYQKLETLGFKKSIISKSDYPRIENIFCNREQKEIVVSGCIPVYRDILIFKQRNRTIGIAKICFDCGMFLIIGSNSNTDGFGQNGGFDKLKSILHP